MPARDNESAQSLNSSGSNNELAEDFLYENGVIGQRSPRRRQILGCIACRWNDLRTSDLDPTVYATQIIKCAGLKSGLVSPLMSQLANGEVLEVTQEDVDPSELGRPRRVFYSPAETIVGERFDELLSVPVNCSLPDELR